MCSCRASGFETCITFWSLSLTKTGFSPAPMHFFVQASWEAFAPFAPHFESLIHPSHVWSLANARPVMQQRYSPITSRTFGFIVLLLFLLASAKLTASVIRNGISQTHFQSASIAADSCSPL